ncbi:MAG: outer membrane beta-barrel protein [Bacteroidetes bacterium]|nr:outer membrane beta-barrel protein [Bacteroidota bacterium]
MKTKLLSLLAASALSSSVALACNDSLRINCGIDQGFHYWEGLDIGVNGYFNNNSSIETPGGYDFLDLDYARSHSIAWNMMQYNIHLYKNHVNLVTGFGLEWNTYSFRQNISLSTNSNSVSATYENIDFDKNKLRTTWLDAPLLLEFNTGKDEDNSFHLAVGGTFGYNIFRNKMIQEYNVNGNEQDRKTKDDYNINPFRYGVTKNLIEESD